MANTSDISFSENIGSNPIPTILFVILLFLSGCNSVRPSWIEENSYASEPAPVTSENSLSIYDGNVGPLGGHFTEEGEWVPDDETIPATYKIPDISAGFLFDIRTLEVSPSIQLELFEFRVPYVGRIKLDAGVAHNKSFLYIGKLWTSIFEISTGVWGGYNWQEGHEAYGISFTIIRF